jgi:hypothetical protein
MIFTLGALDSNQEPAVPKTAALPELSYRPPGAGHRSRTDRPPLTRRTLCQHELDRQVSHQVQDSNPACLPRTPAVPAFLVVRGPRRDLNPHALAGTSTSSWRVCRSATGP